MVYNHGPEYEASVYDVTGTLKGTESKRLEEEGDEFIVKGLPMDLAIWIEDIDTNRLGFNYGAASFWETQILKYFFWESDEKGVSNQFDPDGKYCTVDVEGLQQTANCYFPCPEK